MLQFLWCFRIYSCYYFFKSRLWNLLDHTLVHFSASLGGAHTQILHKTQLMIHSGRPSCERWFLIHMSDIWIHVISSFLFPLSPEHFPVIKSEWATVFSRPEDISFEIWKFCFAPVWMKGVKFVCHEGFSRLCDQVVLVFEVLPC